MDASPEIVEVAPGILRLQLPIDFTGLGHVNTYALEDDKGFTLVDPGLPGEESWKALRGRMDTAGIPLNRVHTIDVRELEAADDIDPDESPIPSIRIERPAPWGGSTIGPPPEARKKMLAHQADLFKWFKP